MKNRIRLFGIYMLYYIFNIYVPITAIWIFTLLWIITLPEKTGNVIFFATECTILMMLIFRRQGDVLVRCHSIIDTPTITMRGINHWKLRKLSSDELQDMFMRDFRKVLKKYGAKEKFRITTHGLYSQGVLKVAFEEFAPTESIPKLSKVVNNGYCVCGNLKISIIKKGIHSNNMAAVKIPVTASQKEIDKFFSKKIQFYQIIVETANL